MEISTGASMCCTVHRKSTPFRKPKNSGGSPSGVRPPPMLATKKIKKITTCTLCLRLSFAFSSGRIISMAAPVVPMMGASRVPMAKSAVLSLGEPCRLPHTRIPPEMVYKASSSRINGMYSPTMACAMRWMLSPKPKTSVNGIRNSSVQPAVILPKWWCQVWAKSSGPVAMDNRIRAKGRPQTRLNSAALKPDALAVSGSARSGNRASLILWCIHCPLVKQ